MSLTIYNSSVRQSGNYQKRITNLYKKKNSIVDKTEKINNNTRKDLQIRDAKKDELLDYLSSDEKKILKEIFGSNNNESKLNFQKKTAITLLIGSKLDVKL
jgi:hypothetical protein